ncbi:unnamed protein product [Vitrella brassicaformis CCMP3155]|uniref:Ankyrin repeat protein n=3 Tax=Vitrella brassicaformis TaxID=1169539 RepID=A0A0G4FYF5_VITBC|nr:unnamed protein product [Vitrella brassicaformis CCMP3155]|eukprot:CEM20045.1 unnamed protein product [Vitrella brassicaformis CCMP3155]
MGIILAILDEVRQDRRESKRSFITSARPDEATKTLEFMRISVTPDISHTLHRSWIPGRSRGEPIHVAAYHANRKPINRWRLWYTIKYSGRDINERDVDGMTPLYLATMNGQLPGVRILLSAGAIVNQRTDHGWTPLACAAFQGYLYILRYLLSEGSDPNACHPEEKITPLMLIAASPRIYNTFLVEQRHRRERRRILQQQFHEQQQLLQEMQQFVSQQRGVSRPSSQQPSQSPSRSPSRRFSLKPPSEKLWTAKSLMDRAMSLIMKMKSGIISPPMSPQSLKSPTRGGVFFRLSTVKTPSEAGTVQSRVGSITSPSSVRMSKRQLQLKGQFKKAPLHIRERYGQEGEAKWMEAAHAWRLNKGSWSIVMLDAFFESCRGMTDSRAETRRGSITVRVSEAIASVSKRFFMRPSKRPAIAINLEQKDKYGRTALMYAATYGHEETVSRLIYEGADPLATTNKGESALHLAVRFNHLDTCELLLKAGVDANITDSLLQTPLHLAIQCNHHFVAELLLSFRARVELSDANGKSPLYLCLDKLPHTSNLFSLCVKHAANICQVDPRGWNLLIYAIENNVGDYILPIVERMAEVEKADMINFRDPLQRTPLHHACAKGDVASVKKLIDLEADVFAKDHLGYTALHLSCEEGNLSVVHIMIDSTPDIDEPNKFGETPIHLAAHNGHIAAMLALLDPELAIVPADTTITDASGRTLLMKACMSGHIDLVHLLLKTRQADRSPADMAAFDIPPQSVNAVDNHGFTALMLACREGHWQIIPALVLEAASVSAKDRDGWTALHWAAHEGEARVVASLIEVGAGVDTQENAGWTPLMLASASGHEEASSVLIDHGADPYRRNMNDDTAYTITRRNGHTAIVQELVDAMRVRPERLVAAKDQERPEEEEEEEPLEDEGEALPEAFRLWKDIDKRKRRTGRIVKTEGVLYVSLLSAQNLYLEGIGKLHPYAFTSFSNQHNAPNVGFFSPACPSTSTPVYFHTMRFAFTDLDEDACLAIQLLSAPFPAEPEGKHADAAYAKPITSRTDLARKSDQSSRATSKAESLMQADDDLVNPFQRQVDGKKNAVNLAGEWSGASVRRTETFEGTKARQRVRVEIPQSALLPRGPAVEVIARGDAATQKKGRDAKSKAGIQTRDSFRSEGYDEDQEGGEGEGDADDKRASIWSLGELAMRALRQKEEDQKAKETAEEAEEAKDPREWDLSKVRTKIDPKEFRRLERWKDYNNRLSSTMARGVPPPPVPYTHLPIGFAVVRLDVLKQCVESQRAIRLDKHLKGTPRGSVRFEMHFRPRLVRYPRPTEALQLDKEALIEGREAAVPSSQDMSVVHSIMRVNTPRAHELANEVTSEAYLPEVFDWREERVVYKETAKRRADVEPPLEATSLPSPSEASLAPSAMPSARSKTPTAYTETAAAAPSEKGSLSLKSAMRIKTPAIRRRQAAAPKRKMRSLKWVDGTRGEQLTSRSVIERAREWKDEEQETREATAMPPSPKPSETAAVLRHALATTDTRKKEGVLVGKELDLFLRSKDRPKSTIMKRKEVTVRVSMEADGDRRQEGERNV